MWVCKARGGGGDGRAAGGGLTCSNGPYRV